MLSVTYYAQNCWDNRLVPSRNEISLSYERSTGCKMYHLGGKEGYVFTDDDKKCFVKQAA